MPLNAALRGKAYPPVAFAVDADRVRRFAAAVGHPGRGVPPTFVTTAEIEAGLANVVGDPDLGLELSRAVHGEQTYEWRRPLRAGDRLTVTTTVEDVRAKGGLEFLELRTDLRDADGELVVVARHTLIVRRVG